jgi:hypothetical protein
MTASGVTRQGSTARIGVSADGWPDRVIARAMVG